MQGQVSNSRQELNNGASQDRRLSVRNYVSKNTIYDSNTYVGTQGEISVDPDTLDVRVHDGATPGGFPIGIGGSLQYSALLQVDPSGIDSVADGSFNHPFATIQAAHDWAVANLDPSQRIVLEINPGNYIEDITITRVRTHLHGPTHYDTKAATLYGSISFSSNTDIGGIFNDTFGIENLNITNPSSSYGIRQGQNLILSI